jgi:hypothetical protein
MTEFICCVKDVLKMDDAFDSTERDCMRFAQLYLAGDAAAGWQKFRDKNPESEHTWAAMKAYLQGCIAPMKHWTD